MLMFTKDLILKYMHIYFEDDALNFKLKFSLKMVISLRSILVLNMGPGRLLEPKLENVFFLYTVLGFAPNLRAID